jgi:hypothetical protein
MATVSKSRDGGGTSLSLSAACASGDHRAALEAMRTVLAEAMEIAPAMVVAQVAARLQAVLVELSELPVAAESSASDDLVQRRALRRAAAKVVG